MSTKPHMIITHAGSFHSDEVVAIALLERFYFLAPLVMTIDEPQETVLAWMNGEEKTLPRLFFPDGTEDARSAVPIVRTRDSLILKKAVGLSDVFVIDVGGEQDDDKLNFDHHQKSMTRTWNDGTPLSSTGLVWLYLRKNGLLNLPEEVLLDVENRLIKPLDLHDNGEGVCHVAGVMAGYNRSSSDPKEQDAQFWRALSMMREILSNTIFAAELKMEARIVLTEEWEKASARGDTVVVLPRAIAYHDCAGLLKEVSGDRADVIAIPGQGNRFSVISVRLDEPFSIKHPCPPEWRGRSDFAVEVKAGRPPIVVKFAHKSGFMCVVEGSAGQAREIARHVVRMNTQKSRPESPKPR